MSDNMLTDYSEDDADFDTPSDDSDEDDDYSEDDSDFDDEADDDASEADDDDADDSDFDEQEGILSLSETPFDDSEDDADEYLSQEGISSLSETPVDDSSSHFDTLNDEIVISSDAFTLSRTQLQVSDLVFLKPLRDARMETHSGLLTSIKEMGLLNPLWVTPTQTYQEHLATNPDDPFPAPKYRVLDGFRRVYSCLKLGITSAPAQIVTFKDPERGAEMAVVLSLILNRNQKHSWGEIWGLMRVLEMQSAMTPATLEWLLNIDPGSSMKLKDVMLCDYPEIVEQFLSQKKSLEQAYNALQKARKEEGMTARDDTRTVETIEGADEITSDASGENKLSDSEVRELLEMSAPSAEDSLEDDNFGGDSDMFGEAAADYVQDTKDRESLSPELRSAIFRRDDFTCQGCRFGEGITSSLQLGLLEAHHVTAVYTGGSDSSENFVTLCNRCHTFVHILAGFNCKIGMSQDEFALLPEADQECIKNCVRYAKVLLEAEKRSGKALKKYRPTRLPFWTRQAQGQQVLHELSKDSDFPSLIVEQDDPNTDTSLASVDLPDDYEDEDDDFS